MRPSLNLGGASKATKGNKKANAAAKAALRGVSFDVVAEPIRRCL
jgi:hypothetical protein